MANLEQNPFKPGLQPTGEGFAHIFRFSSLSVKPMFNALKSRFLDRYAPGFIIKNEELQDSKFCPRPFYLAKEWHNGAFDWFVKPYREAANVSSVQDDATQNVADPESDDASAMDVCKLFMLSP